MSLTSESTSYKLIYHYGEFAGRGEPIRMLLHLSGSTWEDTCRKTKMAGPATIGQLRESGEVKGQPLLFPPTLVDLSMSPPTALNQLPCIMQYLAEKHSLAGSSLMERTRALQITMTWNDLLLGATDAFHPVNKHASYQSQKEEAEPFIEQFLAGRLLVFLKFFEESLKMNNEGTGYMVGSSLTFADVAMLNMMRGYQGSAPKHYQDNQDIPLLKALQTRLREKPRIKEFLQFDRTVDVFLDSFL